jgi:hypothetical protein
MPLTIAGRSSTTSEVLLYIQPYSGFRVSQDRLATYRYHAEAGKPSGEIRNPFWRQGTAELVIGVTPTPFIRSSRIDEDRRKGGKRLGSTHKPCKRSGSTLMALVDKEPSGRFESYPRHLRGVAVIVNLLAAIAAETKTPDSRRAPRGAAIIVKVGNKERRPKWRACHRKVKKKSTSQKSDNASGQCH